MNEMLHEAAEGVSMFFYTIVGVKEELPAVPVAAFLLARGPHRYIDICATKVHLGYHTAICLCGPPYLSTLSTRIPTSLDGGVLSE